MRIGRVRRWFRSQRLSTEGEPPVTQPPQRVHVTHGCGCTTFLLICLVAGLVVQGAGWVGDQWEQRPMAVIAVGMGIGWLVLDGVPRAASWWQERSTGSGVDLH